MLRSYSRTEQPPAPAARHGHCARPRHRLPPPGIERCRESPGTAEKSSSGSQPPGRRRPAGPESGPAPGCPLQRGGREGLRAARERMAQERAVAPVRRARNSREVSRVFSWPRRASHPVCSKPGTPVSTMFYSPLSYAAHGERVKKTPPWLKDRGGAVNSGGRAGPAHPGTSRGGDTPAPQAVQWRDG